MCHDPVIPRDADTIDLGAVETDARNHEYIPSRTVLGLVAMVRQRDAEVERLRSDTARLRFLDREKAERERLQAEVVRLQARCEFARRGWTIARAAHAGTDHETAADHVIIELAEWDRAHPPPATTPLPLPSPAVPTPSHALEDDGPDPDPEPEPSWSDRLRFDFDVSETSPVIIGTWVTTGHVVSLIIDGRTWSEVLRIHPEITEADIRACVAYTIETEDDPEPAKLALEKKEGDDE